MGKPGKAFIYRKGLTKRVSLKNRERDPILS
jgi:hypothetical protein